MKTLLRTVFLSLFISLISAGSANASVGPERMSTSVMTYNIHLQNSGEEAVHWDNRRSNVAQIIRLRKPEILGIQGATFEQSDWLGEHLQQYAVYTPEATETAIGSDVCPIFYDAEHYRALDQGSVNLQSGQHKMFLNWVQLERINVGVVIYVFNTHVDENHQSDKDLLSSIETSIRDIAGEETFVFVGDLGQSPESDFIRSISAWAKDSLTSSLVNISEREATHFGWKVSNKGVRSDYVFLSQDIPANSYEVLDTSFQNAYPSDHLPVFCRLRIEKDTDIIAGPEKNSKQ